jgi:PEP-CTERM motif
LAIGTSKRADRGVRRLTARGKTFRMLVGDDVAAKVFGRDSGSHCTQSEPRVMSTLFGIEPTRFAKWLAGALLALSAAAQAPGALGETLGNAEPGFTDGEVPDALSVGAAILESPAPFNDGLGSDPLRNFATSWTFEGYTVPERPIGFASVAIGIVDHDSASPGVQVAAFSVDGFDLTSGLNALFEAHGGGSGEYNVYTLSLPGPAFASLLDGSATFALALQGPVLSPPLLGGDPVQEQFNGATLIFSRLSITPVPEPGSFAFLALGTLAVVLVARRRSARQSIAPTSRGDRNG